MPASNRIEWRIHCSATPEKLFDLLSTAMGRKEFWAESAEEKNGTIHFRFSNGQSFDSRILDSSPQRVFSVEYFGTVATFHLQPADSGTDVVMINENVPENEHLDMYAGWVSVLLALKAFADFGVDLRNHNPIKTWDAKFVDN